MKILTWILLVFSPFSIAAQEYFQQEVDYKINVKLDTEDHVLTGDISIDYKNNSKDDLEAIYFHLWPNAYSSKVTAFAKQQLELGETAFYFAPDSVLGSIDSLNFVAIGKNLSWSLDESNPDIARVDLDEVLKPGESIRISSAFKVQLPGVFSRLGHHEGAYNISQWFPKPAVYDMDGWHAMPYLDMGEFYSEFGDFEVNITLPGEYVVAATGILDSQEEIDFIEGRIRLSSDVLNGNIGEEAFYSSTSTSNKEWKTITFKAENVHDFAWFAYPHFLIEKKNLVLSSGKVIEAYSYYPPEEAYLWEGSINYVVDACGFYSQKLGDYPYPQVTAVRSKLKAGGGMEYPMITVIDEMPTRMALDGVIAHEVGHNWFYGALATNERDYPWMDEGMNTFYELKYLEGKYGQDPYLDYLPGLLSINDLELSTSHYFYLIQSRRNFEQKSGQKSTAYSSLNYGLAAYQKPALALIHLESYLGEDTFDGLMQTYFDLWSGKHPGPQSFENLVKEYTGKELAWFFNDLLHSNKQLDYKIKSINKETGYYHLVIENKGEIAAPIELFYLSDSKVMGRQWIEGFEGEKEIEIPIENADYFVLDHFNKVLDIQRKNNFIKTNSMLGKSREMDINIWSTTEHSQKNKINIVPVLGGNKYDKFMLGAWIFNPIFPESNFHYSIIPMYAFGTKDLTGLAHFHYSIFPDSNVLRKIKLGLGVKRFHKDRNQDFGYQLGYNRINPSLSLDFHSNQIKVKKHQLSYTPVYLVEEFVQFLSSDSLLVRSEGSLIHRLGYVYERNSALNPWSVELLLEQQDYESIDGVDQNYLKVSASYDASFKYDDNKSIDVRVFGAFFPINSQRETASFDKEIARGSIALLHQGFNDYAFDDYYFGRAEQSGIWSKQISTNRGGGFKNALSSRYAIGLSNDFAVSMNIKANLPIDIPIISMFKPYLDLGYYNTKSTSVEELKGNFLYSGGFVIELPEDILSIHFPLFYSQGIKTAYNDLGGFGSRISFHIDLNKFNPYTILEEIH